MKRARAREIADALNDVKRWNSHGIGINMARIRQDLNLVIDDFGQQPKLNEGIRRYHRLLTDHMSKMNQESIVQTRQLYNVVY